jgi:hypothetical protein
MRKKWIIPLVPLAIAAFIAIGGEVVMHLWNWVLPALFGWRLITFWQALGLLALCRILFGGFGHGGSHRSNFQERMAKRWGRMTPEEREKFRHGIGARCRNFGEPASETKEPA